MYNLLLSSRNIFPVPILFNSFLQSKKDYFFELHKTHKKRVLKCFHKHFETRLYNILTRINVSVNDTRDDTGPVRRRFENVPVC